MKLNDVSAMSAKKGKSQIAENSVFQIESEYEMKVRW